MNKKLLFLFKARKDLGNKNFNNQKHKLNTQVSNNKYSFLTLFSGWFIGFILCNISIFVFCDDKISFISGIIRLIVGLASLMLFWSKKEEFLNENNNAFFLIAKGIFFGISGALLGFYLTNSNLLGSHSILRMCSPFIVVLSGCMGVGKEPVMRYMYDNYGFQIIQRNESSYRFNSWGLMKKNIFKHEIDQIGISLNMEKKARLCNSSIVLLDGTWREDIWCYTRAFAFDENKLITEIDWKTIESLGNYFLGVLKNPDLVINLYCDPYTLKKRIGKYGDGMEKRFPLNYLDLLEAYFGDLYYKVYRNVAYEKVDFSKVDPYSITLHSINAMGNIASIIKRHFPQK